MSSRLLQTLQRIQEISAQNAADAYCGLYVGETKLEKTDIAEENRVVETNRRLLVSFAEFRFWASLVCLSNLRN